MKRYGLGSGDRFDKPFCPKCGEHWDWRDYRAFDIWWLYCVNEHSWKSLNLWPHQPVGGMGGRKDV